MGYDNLIFAVMYAAYAIQLIFSCFRGGFIKRLIFGLSSMTIGATGLVFLITQNDVFGVLMFVICVGAAFSGLRLLENRRSDSIRLNHSVQRSTVVFLILSAMIFVATLDEYSTLSLLKFWAGASLLSSMGIVVNGIYSMLATRSISASKSYSNNELPSISVLIPARNETADLAECLHSVVSSDYPKLEILVLDDCSMDKTPEVIKSFAHDGVRFIEGPPPDEDWLPKNAAYNNLAKQASGDWLIFLGVDTRLSKGTLRNLVSIVMSRDIEMLSVMPLRTNGKYGWALFAPLRYFWELGVPKQILGVPQVLSTLWMIKRTRYDDCGGMLTVPRSVAPERVFAKACKKDNKYAFFRSDNSMGVTTQKTLADQFETAIRVKYPQIRKRPELAILELLFTTLFMIAPYGLLIYGWVGMHSVIVLLCIASIFCLTLLHTIISVSVMPTFWYLGAVGLPLQLLIDAILLLISAYKYEYSEVYWKGRNICLPVMHQYAMPLGWNHQTHNKHRKLKSKHRRHGHHHNRG